MPTYQAENKAQLDKQWPAIALYLKKLFDANHKFELVIRGWSKTREQEKKYHALIADIANHGKIEESGVLVDFNQYENKLPVAKALLIFWFERELAAQGEKLKNPGQWIICPITSTPISVRAASKLFTVKEGSMFIEYLNVIVAENRIALSDRTTQIYTEWSQE